MRNLLPTYLRTFLRMHVCKYVGNCILRWRALVQFVSLMVTWSLFDKSFVETNKMNCQHDMSTEIPIGIYISLIIVVVVVVVAAVDTTKAAV